MKKIIKVTINSMLILILTACSASKLYNEAKLTESIEHYERFLKNYPDNKHYEKAKEEFEILLIEKQWEETSNKNTVIEYEKFIDKYPNSNKVPTARKQISTLKDNQSWDMALKNENIELIKNYLTDFPNGINKESAIAKLFELEVIRPYWNEVNRKGNPLEIKNFIKSHPNGKYFNLAKNKLEIIETNYWEIALETNSIKSFKKYIETFPNGKHSKEANKKIIDIEVDNIFNGNHGYLPPFEKKSNSKDLLTNNEIQIFNNTQYDLTVRYSGNESIKVILAPNEKKDIKIKNGNYRITASVNAVNVSNFAGNDVLKGSRYECEYYIETKLM